MLVQNLKSIFAMRAQSCSDLFMHQMDRLLLDLLRFGRIRCCSKTSNKGGLRPYLGPLVAFDMLSTFEIQWVCDERDPTGTATKIVPMSSRRFPIITWEGDENFVGQRRPIAVSAWHQGAPVDRVPRFPDRLIERGSCAIDNCGNSVKVTNHAFVYDLFVVECRARQFSRTESFRVKPRASMF